MGQRGTVGPMGVQVVGTGAAAAAYAVDTWALARFGADPSGRRITPEVTELITLVLTQARSKNRKRDSASLASRFLAAAAPVRPAHLPALHTAVRQQAQRQALEVEQETADEDDTDDDLPSPPPPDTLSSRQPPAVATRSSTRPRASAADRLSTSAANSRSVSASAASAAATATATAAAASLFQMPFMNFAAPVAASPAVSTSSNAMNVNVTEDDDPDDDYHPTLSDRRRSHSSAHHQPKLLQPSSQLKRPVRTSRQIELAHEQQATSHSLWSEVSKSLDTQDNSQLSMSTQPQQDDLFAAHHLLQLHNPLPPLQSFLPFPFNTYPYAFDPNMIYPPSGLPPPEALNWPLLNLPNLAYSLIPPLGGLPPFIAPNPLLSATGSATTTMASSGSVPPTSGTPPTTTTTTNSTTATDSPADEPADEKSTSKSATLRSKARTAVSTSSASVPAPKTLSTRRNRPSLAPATDVELVRLASGPQYRTVEEAVQMAAAEARIAVLKGRMNKKRAAVYTERVIAKAKAEAEAALHPNDTELDGHVASLKKNRELAGLSLTGSETAVSEIAAAPPPAPAADVVAKRTTRRQSSASFSAAELPESSEHESVPAIDVTQAQSDGLQSPPEESMIVDSKPIESLAVETRPVQSKTYELRAVANQLSESQPKPVEASVGEKRSTRQTIQPDYSSRSLDAALARVPRAVNNKFGKSSTEGSLSTALTTSKQAAAPPASTITATPLRVSLRTIKKTKFADPDVDAADDHDDIHVPRRRTVSTGSSETSVAKKYKHDKHSTAASVASMEDPVSLIGSESAFVEELDEEHLDEYLAAQDAAFAGCEMYHIHDPYWTLPVTETVAREALEIPHWKEAVLPPLRGKRVAEDVEPEDLSDDAFDKRHRRFDVEEKRRKRWDQQALRSRSEYERLLAATQKGNKKHQAKEFTSFYPGLSQIKAIQFCDDLPVLVFGRPLSLGSLTANDFEPPPQCRHDPSTKKALVIKALADPIVKRKRGRPRKVIVDPTVEHVVAEVVVVGPSAAAHVPLPTDAPRKRGRPRKIVQSL